MPSIITALLIASAGVAPGFLLLRGYQRARTYVDPPLNLYAVAQAVVLSSLILLLAYPLVGWLLLRWAKHETLLEGFHPWILWLTLVLLVVMPYVSGLAAGRVVDVLRAPGAPELPPRLKDGRLEKTLLRARDRLAATKWDETVDWLGFGGSRAVWDRVWTLMAGETSPVIVEVDLDADETVIGVFGGDSYVTTSPEPRELFLQTEYEEADVPGDATRVLQARERSKGVFIDATSVKSIRFLEHVAADAEDVQEGHHPRVG